MPANFKNHTIWTGDNLPIMRGLNSESVDLIYLDPPFNSNQDYAAPIGSKAAGAEFKDTWTLTDINVEWVNLIEAKHPALYRVLLVAMTDSDKSYLIYMSARLLEMRRILKPTGSIYLHCDPTMSHYLKLVMDAVFGRRNFRNDIAWKRKAGRGETQNTAIRFGVTSDILLFYSSSSETVLNRQYRPNNPAYIASKFTHVDHSGRRYHLDNLTSPSPRPNLVYEYKGYNSPKNGWAVSRERMEQMDREGRIHFPSDKSKRLRRIRFLDELKGETVDTLWDDLPPINSQAKERVGYPTQKPLALLDRIIKASSNDEDMVLDPFCGCATTCISAQSLGRHWAGIDISPKAAELVRQRMHDELGLFAKVIHRTDIPKRTDLGTIPRHNSDANRKKIYGEQEGHCNGCRTHFELRNLEVDHIIARNDGGTDHIENLQLLCGNCNRIKGDRGMEYLRLKLRIGTHPSTDHVW